MALMTKVGMDKKGREVTVEEEGRGKWLGQKRSVGSDGKYVFVDIWERPEAKPAPVEPVLDEKKKK